MSNSILSRSVMRARYRLLAQIAVLFATVPVLAAFSHLASGTGGLQTSLTGTVALVWGDGPPEKGDAVGPFAILTDDSGTSAELLFDESTLRTVGGLLALDRKRIEIKGAVLPSASRRAPITVGVQALRLLDSPAAPTAVLGAQPWVSIMCKFQDVAAEPRNLAYFQGMYTSAFPGLDHYWREVSHSNISVAGSTAYGWFTLPHPRSHYIGTSANLTALFNDCTGVADPSVNFAPFVGINLMFNDNLDGYAWGGGRWATLDGVTRLWYVTWEPPWGYNSISVMSHEMGHGFGLPHSNFNGGSPYDNSWDVMSDSWAGSGTHATYGHYAQHTISHHKNFLGWLRLPEKRTVGVGQSTSVRLERLGFPGFAITKMVTIPVGGSSSNFYTVEARQRQGYDVQVPGDATIIHHVDTSRQEPAWVMGTNGGMGAAWAPGSLFRDAANSIGVAVTSTTSSASGYAVAVANGPSLAASFPSIDSQAAAGTTSNLNGILEPGERVQFVPAWTNVTTSSIAGVTGSSGGFAGPAGASYSVPDSTASYGTLASGSTADCSAQGNCYQLQVSNPATRPATHWDATFTENLSGGITRSWTLHIGNSFTDVPTSFWAYRFVETLLHSGLTAGCSATQYCPASPVNRWQMAVFLATALAGSGSAVPVSGTVSGMGSYNCITGGTSVFTDVPPSDGGCKFIHYIAAFGITAGCGANIYCPSDSVTRWQMAVFLSVAMSSRGALPVSGTISGLGSFNCTSGGSTVFSDVLPTDGGCRSVHFIAKQGVTAGCAAGLYCPATVVTRDQMAVFLSTAFGFGLYNP